MRAFVVRAWGKILLGRRPVLSIELTNKCPLSCSGCYAYQPNHLSGVPLESIPDYRGDELVRNVLEILDKRRPLSLFLVGGEPLVRVKELSLLLPEICRRGIQIEVVTSGVVPIPTAWRGLRGLKLVVSIDGLQPEHDLRRKPATYERILKNIRGQKVQIHCTVTSQMASKETSLPRFLDFWSDRPEVDSIRMSLYTPQVGEASSEILSPEMKRRFVNQLARLSVRYRQLRLAPNMIQAYLEPPRDPVDCIFSRVTECLSSDLETSVVPCQLGGEPDCSQCGCVAAVALQAVGRHRLPGGLRLAPIFRVSSWIGGRVARSREAASRLRALLSGDGKEKGGRPEKPQSEFPRVTSTPPHLT